LARKSFRALAEIEPVYEELRKQHPLLLVHGISELIATQVQYPLSTIKAIVKDIEERKRIGIGDTSTLTQTVAPANPFSIGNPNPFFNVPKMPESWARDRIPYRLPIKESKIGLLYDPHIPYHLQDSVAMSIEYGVRKGWDTVILGGDIVDCASVSRFIKPDKDWDLAVEMAVGVQFLEYLRFKFPVAKIIYLEGNHESHIRRYTLTEAKAARNLKGMQIENILELDRFGIEYVSGFRRIEAGENNIIHGHEIPGGGENVARNKMKRAMANITFGHSHLEQKHIVKNIRGKYMGAFAIPCLCHPSPDYNPNNQWATGFGDMTLFANGNFHLDTKMIIDGRIL
jgi:predicted phosphodiesterase